MYRLTRRWIKILKSAVTGECFKDIVVQRKFKKPHVCFSKRSINRATFELHESHCLRHIKLCEECGEPVPLKDIDEHFKENHAPQPCGLCGDPIAPDDLQDHQVHYPSVVRPSSRTRGGGSLS